MTWLLDLDGVVWLAGRPIPGGHEAIAHLRRSGQRVVFFTNNSGPTVREYLELLAAAGVTGVVEEDVLTSAQAAATLVRPGSRVSVVGDAGLREALASRHVQEVLADGHAAALVAGRTTELSYDGLAAAARVIRSGAAFVATNTDPTFPTPNGPVPGAGAIIAFLVAASGRQAVVAGKPAAPAVELVRRRVGPVDVVVGDRPDTDGLFARALGARFALVLSGATRRGDLPVDPSPDMLGDDLAAVVDEALRPQ